MNEHCTAPSLPPPMIDGSTPLRSSRNLRWSLVIGVVRIDLQRVSLLCTCWIERIWGGHLGSMVYSKTGFPTSWPCKHIKGDRSPGDETAGHRQPYIPFPYKLFIFFFKKKKISLQSLPRNEKRNYSVFEAILGRGPQGRGIEIPDLRPPTTRGLPTAEDLERDPPLTYEKNFDGV